MKFSDAWKLLLEGKMVKLPSWGGYWIWNEEDDTIHIHEKDGNIVKFNSEKLRTKYTIENMLRNDWVLADDTNCPLLGGEAKFELEDAIRYAKRNLKIRLNWWPEGVYVDTVCIDPDPNLSESQKEYIFTYTDENSNNFYTYSTLIDKLSHRRIGSNIDTTWSPSIRCTAAYWTWFEDKTINEKVETDSNINEHHSTFGLEEAIKYAGEGRKIRMIWWPEGVYVNEVITIIDTNGEVTYIHKFINSNPYNNVVLYCTPNHFVCVNGTSYSCTDETKFKWEFYKDEDKLPIVFGLEEAIKYAEKGCKIRLSWWPEGAYVDKHIANKPTNNVKDGVVVHHTFSNSELSKCVVYTTAFNYVTIGDRTYFKGIGSTNNWEFYKEEVPEAFDLKKAKELIDQGIHVKMIGWPDGMYIDIVHPISYVMFDHDPTNPTLILPTRFLFGPNCSFDILDGTFTTKDGKIVLKYDITDPANFENIVCWVKAK